MASNHALQTCLQDDVHGDQGQAPHAVSVKSVWLILIQSASDRAIDRHIRNKLREATISRGFITSPLFSITGSPIPAPLPDIAESTTVSTRPMSSDPHTSYSFADRCLSPTLTDAVSNVDSVEMTALQSTTTGGQSRSLSTVSPMLTCNLDPAVLLRLRRQDELPQHFVAAFLPDPPPGLRKVGEGKISRQNDLLAYR
jgi:hypothetical protein